jgi:hypothetical protein
MAVPGTGVPLLACCLCASLRERSPRAKPPQSAQRRTMMGALGALEQNSGVTRGLRLCASLRPVHPLIWLYHSDPSTGHR